MASATLFLWNGFVKLFSSCVHSLQKLYSLCHIQATFLGSKCCILQKGKKIFWLILSVFMFCFSYCRAVLICKKASWTDTGTPQWGDCCRAGRTSCQGPCWLAWLIRLRLYQSDIWSLYAEAPSNDSSCCGICAVIVPVYFALSLE